jgi:hypothetical protein
MDINTAIENKLENILRKNINGTTLNEMVVLMMQLLTNMKMSYTKLKKNLEIFIQCIRHEIAVPGIFGMRESTGWVNHPNNYLDEAS